MQELFKKIKKNGRRLEFTYSQIEDVRTMPYYAIYGNPNEREKDLNNCYAAVKAQLNERQIHLENLQLEINKELNRVSQALKCCALKKVL
jgi:hypothetical protein